MICTWDCDDLPQLLFQAHDVFAELNVIHPEEFHEKRDGGAKKKIIMLWILQSDTQALHF